MWRNCIFILVNILICNYYYYCLFIIIFFFNDEGMFMCRAGWGVGDGRGRCLLLEEVLLLDEVFTMLFQRAIAAAAWPFRPRWKQSGAKYSRSGLLVPGLK